MKKKASAKAKKVSKAVKVKTLHKTLVKQKLEPKKTVNFKVTVSEAKQIKAVADKYCDGNVTALVKLSVAAFKPSKRDLVSVR